MNYQVKHNGVDITSYIHSYRRTQRICAGIGTAEISIIPTYASAINPYSPFEIYEDSIKKGTYFTQTISRVEPVHLIEVLAQDVSKMLVDYFIADSYEITEPSSAKYWIEFLLQQAHVTYSFLPEDEGHPMSLNTSIGQESLLDRIQILCAENGWYFLADENNTLVIGDLELDFNNFTIAVTDEATREFGFVKNDKMLRNRVIVRGTANPYTKIWVCGEVKAITPWNYDTLDYRTTVITAPDIPDVGVATQLANQLFAETKKITEVKEVNIAGYHNAGCGDTIYINHSTYQGTGLITSISVQTVGNGATTTYIVDERCPRMFGYYRGIGDVFISTYGNGVWRKPIKYTHTWSNYSSGLTNLYVTDLSVANGILACSTNTGQLFTSFPTESGWVRTYPANAVDPNGRSYVNTQMEVNSVSVDPMTGIVRAGVNYTNPNNTPSGIRSWVAEVDANKVVTMVPITYSGIVDIGTWDLETNDYATYIQGVRGQVTSELVVDPTKEGCLNNVATSTYTEYQYYSKDMLPGQINTIKYIDNNDLEQQQLHYSNFQLFSIYAEMLYATGDNFLRRYDLINHVFAGENLDFGFFLDGTGYPTNHEICTHIEAISRTVCAIFVKKKYSSKHVHVFYFDFTDTNNITRETYQMNIPDSVSKDYSISDTYHVNSRNERVVLIHAIDNFPGYRALSYYKIFNFDTKVETDWLELSVPEPYPVGTIENIPDWVKMWYPYNAGTEYNYVNSDGLSYNTVHVGHLGQCKVPVICVYRTSTSYNATINQYPYYRQVIFPRISRELRTIDINTGEVSLVAHLPDDIEIDGYSSRPNEYGSYDIYINPNNTTTLRIQQTYWKVVGPEYTCGYNMCGDYETIYTEYVYRGTELTHTFFDSSADLTKRRTTMFTNNKNLFVFPSNTTLSGMTWDTSEITDTTVSEYRQVVSGYYSNDVDDDTGKLLSTKVYQTIGTTCYSRIYDESGNIVLSNAVLTGSTLQGGGTPGPGVNIVGGVLLWRDNGTSGVGQSNYVGFFRAIYSTNLFNKEQVNLEYPLLEYKPNTPMKLLGYTNSQYINASQTRPIVLYGGDQGYNNGTWDVFDPVDNSYSNIFVSGFVSDTTTMRYLTDQGLSTCILSCIQPPSGTQETDLFITDHDGILTSGNDYGGLVILEGGIIYTDPWHTYTMSGWHTFSGIVTHVETSNFDDQPYVFVSTTVSGVNHFYQLDSRKLEEASKQFVERSTNLPGATITRIRLDDRI